MATLTLDVLDFTTPVINRRPFNNWQVRLNPGGEDTTVICRRASPTTPQFSGTIDPTETKLVHLVRRSTGTTLEKMRVDGSGNFASSGWYPPEVDDFGFRFVGPDGYESRTFPVSVPAYNQWNGNPSVNDSAVGARP